ncbi:MAG: transporter substrate-binding domain-containing protein [Betaproteobacteria bacterium]|nr:transporter substrate-binding domain-containing protein [Betaproteobacteria bacterium]
MKNLFIVLLCLVAASVCASEEEGRAVKVGLLIGAPFVIDLGSGDYSGLAFNLWEMIAEHRNVKSEYFPYHSIGQILEGANNGEIDIIVGNLAVSHDRAENLKFSFPWYDDGLRILVTNHGHSISVWNILRERGHIRAYMWILLVVVALAVGQALLRRKKDIDFPACWLEGMSLSLNEVVRSAKAGVPQKNVLGWVGYLILTLWMIFGFILLAYVTSTLTSAMTTASIQRGGEINSLTDLAGRKTAVPANSVGERYMRETGARLLSFETLEEAVDALMKNAVVAVVWDAAELEYWVHSHQKMDVEVVGNTFSPQKYAFAASKKYERDARQMDAVSEEVIRLLGDGTVEGLKDKYFGVVRF